MTPVLLKNPADKGGAICILNHKEVKGQLSDRVIYEKLDKDQIPLNEKKLMKN